MRADVSSGGTFLAQLFVAAGWLWQRVVSPLLHLFWRWGVFHVKQYRRLWSLVVYRRTTDGELLFSKTRAGLFAGGSILFFWFIAIPLIDGVWDAGIYLLTAERNEHVYLLGSQEIDSWTGAHVIEGCSKLPCSDRDAIYFRTAGGLFNNLWSLMHGRGLFYPEYVGAAVPYATSKCIVTSYGVRIRLPFRIVNTYSYLLAVTCSPLSKD
jgi:hypothetical protein